MKKIAVVGPYGVGADFTTGQAVKCFEIINWLKNRYGDEQVYIVNTFNWKKNPVKLFFRMIFAFIFCKNIAIMPAQNGAKIFLPMSYYLKKIFNRYVHYIVIGGWIKEILTTNKRLFIAVKSFEGVYVETKSMVEKLNSIGLLHNYYMPNCRNLPDTSIVKSKEWDEPIPVCTYSRVTKEKGIIDAVEIVKRANEKQGRKVFKLDVYGKIASEFQEEFDWLIEDNKELVTYCGIKNADEGISTLAEYYALLFPTFYEGEGVAGTLLDAFASGTPAIVNDWKYNSEIIESGKNGFVYLFRDNDMAADILCKLYDDTTLYYNIVVGCNQSATLYSTDVVMDNFVEHLA